MGSFFIIDRRLNPKGKSLANRQRFIRRTKAQIRDSLRETVGDRKLTDSAGGETITIPSKGIAEPRFHHSRSGGYRERVLPGNKEFSVGDKIQKPQGGAGGEGGKEATDSGDGEDEFEFALTHDEFLDLFFEDLELPDLVKTSLKEVVAYKPERAGMTTAGTAANLNLVRTMRNSFARRLALKRPSNDAIEELEKRLFALENKADPDARDHDEMKAVRAELAAMTRRRLVVPYIDTNYLRYNNFISRPSPNTQAVMFCLMDVSGSMAQ